MSVTFTCKFSLIAACVSLWPLALAPCVHFKYSPVKHAQRGVLVHLRLTP